MDKYSVLLPGKNEQKLEAESERVELTLVDGRLVFGVAFDVLGEPLVKLIVGIKQCGHDEVQQGPQLRDRNNTHTFIHRSHERT